MNKYIYKFHRWTGIIVCIPVIMWTLSGIMHPIMGHLKPKVANDFLFPETIFPENFKVSLKNALEKNTIEEIENFRIVRLDKVYYYQVKLPQIDIPVYLNTDNGEQLAEGDKKYAGYLAEKFLGDSLASLQRTEFVTSFNDEYKSINRLLPVYKVSFDREDNIRLYVETFGSRLASSVDTNRSIFLWIFGTFHTWDFLKDTESLRLFVLILLTSLAFITACLGILNFVKTFRKNGKIRTDRQRFQKYHRTIGIVASVTMLMFSFSGAYHAFIKFTPDDRHKYFTKNIFKTNDLSLPLDSISLDTKSDITNVSLAQLPEGNFYQVYIKSKEKPLPPLYVNVKDGSILKGGGEKYARQIARKFSGYKEDQITSCEYITAFEGEYGFVNKRLPVMKVNFNQDENIRYYIETSTGKLGAKINDSDLNEGLIFSFLHKFHFLDFLGKDLRNFIMAVCALLSTIATVLGITIFIYWRKSKKQKLRVIRR